MATCRRPARTFRSTARRCWSATSRQWPPASRRYPAVHYLYRVRAHSSGAGARSALVPFFRVHDSRYMIYWRAVPPDRSRAVVSRLAVEEKERLALEARTIDRVTPGEQQPEVDHAFAGEETNTGEFNGRRRRDGKSFQYTLNMR